METFGLQRGGTGGMDPLKRRPVGRSRTLDADPGPTAAALAFGERLGYLDAVGAPRDTLTLLVYDLGGGTFDVTVIRITPGEVTTLATDGDAELGGYNWDLRLVDHVIKQFTDRFPRSPEPDTASRFRLRQAAEEAKHTLSARAAATVSFEFGGQCFESQITRNEFEEITADLVERTVFTTRQAIKAAGLLWTDIDRLLLVGGSTRMPMIQQKLTEISDMKPDANVNPDEAVARGAAIYAQYLLQLRGITSVPGTLKVTDANAHSLGIEGVNQDTLRTENVVFIRRNTSLPYEVHRTFVTRELNQQSVKIQLLEGESTLPGQCTKLAKAAIRHLPAGLPEGTKIDVCYRFDANCRLTVRAKMSSGGDEAQIELERVRGLSDECLASWQQIVCRDGGFSGFGDALTELLEREVEIDEATQEVKAMQSSVQRVDSLEPAVPVGAPVASSETLKRERDKQRRRKRKERSKTQRKVKSRRLQVIIFALGHIIFSLVGLAIGYYLVCWINPEANFLELDLPGLSATSNGSPSVPR